jgi:parallel beta-helix repeat protein
MQFLRLPRYFKTLSQPRATGFDRRRSHKGLRSHRLHFEQLETRTLLAAVFTVTNTSDVDDGGPGTDANVSLREAIRNANVPGGPDIINFNIPTSDPGHNGEWWTIRLNSALPTLTDSDTTINGFSQPEAGSDVGPNVNLVGTGGTVGVDNVVFPQFEQPEIAIDGNASDLDPNLRAIVIAGNASNILIKGMAIYDVGRPLGMADDFDVAIRGEGGSGTNRVVESMLVGLLPDGSDPGPLERNRGFGVRQASGGQLTVTKSYVGFNGRGGLDGEANTSRVTFTYNEVFESGWASGDHDGIDVNGVNSSARYNLSRNNTNSSMVLPTGGSGSGIELGSQAAGTGGNFVENNTVFGNLSAGISVRAGASFNTISKNVIFDNQVGISVNEENRLTHRNQISENSIYMNFGLGIDLQHKLPGGFLPGQWVGSPDGGNDTPLTGQDHCDPDTGSNDLQNYPILNSVLVSGGSTTISGTLDSEPNTTYTIEFFSTPDGTLFTLGDREGKDFIGSIQVTTGITGNTGDPCTAAFNHIFNTTVSDDDVITATATKFTDANTPWSTSEFSPSLPVVTLQEKVTGGGWYNQPITGTPTPTLQDDRANFGFNAQYKKLNTVPQGVTNFKYHPANLHFLSTSYAELSLFVVEIAPDVFQATWRGLGKVNNVSGYGFRADVRDAGEPGTFDTFHIKIWRELDGDPFTEDPIIVYDNDPTSAGTVLGGGNIQVHMRPNALEGVGQTPDLPLTEVALQSAMAEAIGFWRHEGVDVATLASLVDTRILVTNLPEPFLGVAANGVIGIDEAAGSNFVSVVTHELGHLLGFDHDHDNPVMTAMLDPGHAVAHSSSPPTPSAFEAGTGSFPLKETSLTALPAAVASISDVSRRDIDAASSIFASGAQVELVASTALQSHARLLFSTDVPPLNLPSRMAARGIRLPSLSQSDDFLGNRGGVEHVPILPSEVNRDSQNMTPSQWQTAPQRESDSWFFPLETDEMFLPSLAREEIRAKAPSAAAHWRRACEDFFAETAEVEFAEPAAGAVAAARVAMEPAMLAAITLLGGRMLARAQRQDDYNSYVWRDSRPLAALCPH